MTLPRTIPPIMPAKRRCGRENCDSHNPLDGRICCDGDDRDNSAGRADSGEDHSGNSGRDDGDNHDDDGTCGGACDDADGGDDGSHRVDNGVSANGDAGGDRHERQLLRHSDQTRESTGVTW